MKHFKIQPNCSMTWKQMMVVFYIMLSISSLIAVFFALYGLWMVIPFTGFEMLVLWLAMAYVHRKSMKLETIDIENGSFLLRVKQAGKEQVFKWYLPWVNIETLNSRFDIEKKRLMIRYKDERVEIANGLHEEEKNLLAIALKKAIASA